jgi:hypothetical protein
LCVDYLTLYALETDGLFRIPGNMNEVEELSNQFEKKHGSMQLLMNSNPNNVASYLKVIYLFKISIKKENRILKKIRISFFHSKKK